MPKWLKILLAVVAVCVVLAVAGVIGGVMYIRSHVDRQVLSPQAAQAEMEAARQPFSGATPIVEMRDDGPALTRPIPEKPATTRLKTVHVLQWNPDQAALFRANLPFAMLRFNGMPIGINTSTNSDMRFGRSFHIRGEEIERFGPALLFDQKMPDGSHLLIWTE